MKLFCVSIHKYIDNRIPIFDFQSCKLVDFVFKQVH